MSGELQERKVDRSGWPAGPWDGEPDRWEDRELGFPVLAVRNDTGFWCGYVGVPPGHPWYQGNDEQLDDARAHGGITYCGLCQGHICHVARTGEPAEVFWIGFDCAHVGDAWPGPANFGHLEKGDEYRTLDYVQRELRELAKQAAAAVRR